MPVYNKRGILLLPKVIVLNPKDGKATNSLKPDEAVEKILDLFAKTRNNREFVEMVKKIRFF